MEISLLLSAAQSAPYDGPESAPQQVYFSSAQSHRYNENSTSALNKFDRFPSTPSGTSSSSTLPRPQNSSYSYFLRAEGGRVDKKVNKPFRCSVEGCEATFGQKGSLTRHVKSRHEKLRPHLCDLCQKRFSALWTLRVHRRNVHLKSKPHKCHLCDKAFGELFNKSKHIAIVHEGKRPFSCPICSRAFGYKGDMRKHVLELHEQPGRPFQCMVPSCGVKFARKRYLRRHENLSHRGNTSFGIREESAITSASPSVPCTYTSKAPISFPRENVLKEERTPIAVDPLDVRDLGQDVQILHESVKEPEQR